MRTKDIKIGAEYAIGSQTRAKVDFYGTVEETGTPRPYLPVNSYRKQLRHDGVKVRVTEGKYRAYTRGDVRTVRPAEVLGPAKKWRGIEAAREAGKRARQRAVEEAREKVQRARVLLNKIVGTGYRTDIDLYAQRLVIEGEDLDKLLTFLEYHDDGS